MHRVSRSAKKLVGKKYRGRLSGWISFQNNEKNYELACMPQHAEDKRQNRQ